MGFDITVSRYDVGKCPHCGKPIKGTMQLMQHQPSTRKPCGMLHTGENEDMFAEKTSMNVLLVTRQSGEQAQAV